MHLAHGQPVPVTTWMPQPTTSLTLAIHTP